METAVQPGLIDTARRAAASLREGGLNQWYEAVLWRRRVATQEAFVRKTFRDGAALLDALRCHRPVQKAVLRDGRVLVHPNRVGLIDTLIELWHHRGYTQGLYRPRAGDVVIDAGANVGVFSAFILRACPGARVLPIEPAQENLDCLRRNIETFGGRADDITAAALGAEPGEVSFLIASRSLDHRIVTTEEAQAADPSSGTVSRVPVVTLEQVMERAGVDEIDLLKLDIESGEYALFDGVSDQTLRRCRRIAIEPHPDLAGRPAQDLINRIRHLFDVRWYGPLLQASRR